MLNVKYAVGLLIKFKLHQVSNYVDTFCGRRQVICGGIVFAKKLYNAPPSVKYIYRLLELIGPMSRTEIEEESLLPPRTVGYALRILLDKRLITKAKNAKDKRKIIYKINGTAAF